MICAVKAARGGSLASNNKQSWLITTFSGRRTLANLKVTKQQTSLRDGVWKQVGSAHAGKCIDVNLL